MSSRCTGQHWHKRKEREKRRAATWMVVALYTIVVQKVVMLFLVVLGELVEAVEDGLLGIIGDVDGGVD